MEITGMCHVFLKKLLHYMECLVFLKKIHKLIEQQFSQFHFFSCRFSSACLPFTSCRFRSNLSAIYSFTSCRYRSYMSAIYWFISCRFSSNIPALYWFTHK
jgi:hypothetical protein